MTRHRFCRDDGALLDETSNTFGAEVTEKFLDIIYKRTRLVRKAWTLL
jgi:hypothetical protein